jgi:hypothetical protein
VRGVKPVRRVPCGFDIVAVPDTWFIRFAVFEQRSNGAERSGHGDTVA